MPLSDQRGIILDQNLVLKEPRLVMKEFLKDLHVELAFIRGCCPCRVELLALTYPAPAALLYGPSPHCEGAFLSSRRCDKS